MQSYFDPKTGELIGGEIGAAPQQSAQQNNPQEQQYQYNTNNQQTFQQDFQQPQPPKKGCVPKKLLLGIGIGCGALVVAGVLIFVVSQLLLSNPVAKISTAAANTFKGGQLYELFNPTGIVNKDGMAVDLLLEVEGEKIGMSAAYQQSKSKKAANAKIDMDIDGEELALEGTIELDKDRIALSVPQIGDTIYTYYYTKENDGFLTDELDDDDIEMLNEVLAKLYDFGYASDSEAAEKAIAELITAELAAMEIEELEKEEFEVNDKDVNCAGYLVTVTEDNMMNIVDGLADVYDEYYADSMDDLLDELYLDMGDFFDELEYTFEDMPDIELSFYLYKKQLACVKMEVDGEDGAAYAYFYGGDYPAQNMEIVFEDDDDEYSICRLEGSIKNQVETMLVEVEEEEICEINYNQKTGEIEISGGEYMDFDISAVVTRKGNTLTLEMDDLEIDGLDASGSITISGDVDIKLPKGEELDLGNASEDVWEDLAEDLEDFIDENELYYYY